MSLPRQSIARHSRDWFSQALGLHQAGHLDGAAQLCCRILSADKHNFEALHLLGALEAQRGNLGKAHQLLRKALKLRPRSAGALITLGNVLNLQNQLEEALAAYTDALRVEPNSSLALNQRGILLSALQRLDEARASFDAALKIKHDYADALHNRGILLLKAHCPAEALTDLDKARALRPNDPRILLARGNALLLLSRIDDAIESFETALTIAPGFAEAMFGLGRAQRMQNRRSEALASYDRTLLARPDYPDALAYRGLTLHELSRYDEALACHDRALLARPDYPEVLANRGLTLHELSRYDEALACHDRALALQPDLAKALINRGDTLCKLRRAEDAIAAYDKALAVEAQLGRGNLLQREEREYELAQPAYRRALALALDWLAVNQNEPDAELMRTVFNLAAALDMAGHNAEAWQLLVAANRPMAAANQADLTADIARRDKTLTWLRAASFRDTETNDGGKGPISLFILGPSRSGKTSLERLVASLDGTKTGYESLIVDNAIRRTFQAAAIPARICLEDVPLLLLPSFRENYLEDLGRQAGSARVFTNTIPGRIYDAGLIAKTIPNVRFLLVKRSLEDTALRIYMTKYLVGNSYAYDLKSIRDYLNWYNVSIDLIAEKLPRIARIVTYENMITDPAATLRAAADLCGVTVGDRPMPVLGDDRGCAAPYRQYMGAAQ